MSSKDSYILHIEWDRPTSDSPKLPENVGPFPTRDEAIQWAVQNIPNGSVEVWPLAWPYAEPPMRLDLSRLDQSRLA